MRTATFYLDCSKFLEKDGELVSVFYDRLSILVSSPSSLCFFLDRNPLMAPKIHSLVFPREFSDWRKVKLAVRDERLTGLKNICVYPDRCSGNVREIIHEVLSDKRQLSVVIEDSNRILTEIAYFVCFGSILEDCVTSSGICVDMNMIPKEFCTSNQMFAFMARFYCYMVKINVYNYMQSMAAIKFAKEYDNLEVCVFSDKLTDGKLYGEVNSDLKSLDNRDILKGKKNGSKA
jgi:hypothetical protein